MMGEAHFHTQAISFEQKLQTTDHFLLNSHAEAMNPERVPPRRGSCHLQAFSSLTDGRPKVSRGPLGKTGASAGISV